MSSKQDLFTIGEFSTVTGVGIHSLRYYDEIGALKPAYVDPVSSYRYYSFDQLRLIPGINICKDAGIKLSEFDKYIGSEHIDYTRLFSESKAAIERKIENYRAQQDELTRFESLLRLKELMPSGSANSLYMESHDVWAVAYGSEHITDNECDMLVRLSSHARKHGCQISPVLFGLLRVRSDGDDKTYAFSDIQDIRDPVKADPYIIRIPSGYYSVRSSTECSLDHAGELTPAGTGPADVIMSFVLMGDDLHSNQHYNAASCG